MPNASIPDSRITLVLYIYIISCLAIMTTRVVVYRNIFHGPNIDNNKI